MKNIDIENTNDNELIMLYHEENEDAKNILFYKYKFIIDILIKKYQKYFIALNIDFQEIYSECTVGFSDGIRNYQDDKSASLPTFITLCVERRISSIIRKYNRDKYKLLHETYSLDFTYEDTDLSLMDMISDDFDNDPLKSMTDKEEYDELMVKIKEVLTLKEYDVFSLMIKGLNYIEIAKILNQTPKQVDNSMQRVKNKIKTIIKEKQAL